MGKIKFNINGVIVEKEFDEISQASEKGTEIKLESDNLIIKSEDNIIYKKEDFETFKTNLSNDEYKKGKTAGVEMAVKEAKEKHGLEFEGKSMDSFANAFKTKIESDSKIEPNAKVEELQTDLESVRGNYATLQSDFDTFKTGITEKETRAKKDATLLSFIPENGLKVSRGITAMALKTESGIDIDYDESGKSIVVMNGEIVKNKITLAPIDPASFIIEQLTILDLIKKPEGGGGGGDDTGNGSVSNYDKFVKEMESNDITEGSEKFGIEMNKRIKEKTLVI